MFKYIFILLAVAVTGASAYLIDVRSPDFTRSQRTAAPIRKIYATGAIEGATREIQVRPELRGRVVEIPIAIGQVVSQGDVLLRLDDSRQRQLVAASLASLQLAQAQLEQLQNGARQAERDEARALLQAKRARLEQARRSWTRIEQLNQQSAVSQQEADNERSGVEALTAEVAAAAARLEQLEAPPRADEVRAAQARVAAAQAEYDLAVIEHQRCTLAAPAAGRVLDVDVEPGELIGPDSAAPAVVLADTAKMRVRAYVEEIDAPRLRLGMPAAITADGLPEQVALGKVEFISPRMTPKEFTSEEPNELYDTKVREVLIDVLDPTALIVGLRVDVVLHPEDSHEGAELMTQMAAARQSSPR
ncbi:MAG: hypothetical protein DCC67_15815 [Planctomycetota bacterium]|nr:MAG: hypothetical protein DCC67_15815 [Planctomycetota bacterium]